MELNSKTSKKIDFSVLQKKEETKKEPEIELDEEDDPLQGKEIKLTMAKAERIINKR